MIHTIPYKIRICTESTTSLDCLLIHPDKGHWFQLLPDQEVVIRIDPISFIIKIADFDAEGEVETEYAASTDTRTLRHTIKRVKKAGISGYGTRHPIRIGWVDNVEIWASYVVEVFIESTHVSLALYSKPREVEDASS